MLNSLLDLALSLSPSNDLTLLRARATSLSFALLPSTAPASTNGSTLDENPADMEDGDPPMGRADPDVLPTVLAYKDGALEHNWVRVDWDLKHDGLEGLLRR